MPLETLSLVLVLSVAPSSERSVTTDEGVEDYPSFSPDGRELAYAASTVGDVFGGNWDVWVVDLETGERRNVTADHALDDRFPSFSPDGEHIAFWSEREGGAYFIVPAKGGAPRKVPSSPTFPSGPAAWTADGTRVTVMVRTQDGIALEVVPLERSGASRRFPVAGKSTRRFDLSASPDGRFLAYVDGSSLTAHVTQLFVLDTRSGENTAVTDGWSNDWSPFWSPKGDALYFVSNRTGKKDVWKQTMDGGRPSGEATAITKGVGIRHATISPDGKHLVYSRGQTVANVWRAPILRDRPARWDDAEPVTEGEAYVEFISLSPDGRRLVTTSDASGNPDLWIVDLESRASTRLTNDPTPDWGPAWSPDGGRIAFYAYRSGNRDLWVMPAEGGTAQRLTDHPSADMYPTWSPDGSHIAFYSVRSGNRDVWVMPSDGGEATQLTRHPGDDLFPHWSPDGERIAFYSDRDGGGRIWTVTPDGADVTEATEGPGRFPRFSRDGGSLLFTGWGARLGSVYERNLDNGTERALTNLTGRPGNLGSYVLATDGRYAYFTWERNVGDLYLLELPTPSSR